MHLQTPLIESRPLSRLCGCRIWLKMEALQPTGSFKIRGVGTACAEYARRGARRLLSSSGGNAGIAVAYAGRRLSLPVVVVVPTTTTDRARSLIESEGAELIVHGESWQEANRHAHSLQDEGDAFIHPFDDPLLWEGHATLIEEVRAAGLRPDAMLVAVGGGGLLCGIAGGAHQAGWDAAPIVAVETAGAESYARAVAADELVELPAITSIATSLGARQVCARALEWARQRPIVNLVVTDEQAVRACLKFLDDHRVLVEPACGAVLAALYEGAFDPGDAEDVLMVVCGGAVTALKDLQRYLQ